MFINQPGRNDHEKLCLGDQNCGVDEYHPRPERGKLKMMI
jgi:hypothetical protein